MPKWGVCSVDSLVIITGAQLLQQHERSRYRAGAVVGVEATTQAAARTGARLVGHRQLAALGEVHRAIAGLKLKGHLLGHVDA